MCCYSFKTFKLRKFVCNFVTFEKHSFSFFQGKLMLLSKFESENPFFKRYFPAFYSVHILHETGWFEYLGHIYDVLSLGITIHFDMAALGVCQKNPAIYFYIMEKQTCTRAWASYMYCKQACSPKHFEQNFVKRGTCTSLSMVKPGSQNCLPCQPRCPVSSSC